jgi:hypothetical protein
MIIEGLQIEFVSCFAIREINVRRICPCAVNPDAHCALRLRKSICKPSFFAVNYDH